MYQNLQVGERRGNYTLVFRAVRKKLQHPKKTNTKDSSLKPWKGRKHKVHSSHGNKLSQLVYKYVLVRGPSVQMLLHTNGMCSSSYFQTYRQPGRKDPQFWQKSVWKEKEKPKCTAAYTVSEAFGLSNLIVFIISTEFILYKNDWKYHLLFKSNILLYSKRNISVF